MAQRAAEEASRRFGVTVVGHHHGYFDRVAEAGAVCAAVRAANADLLLAGLGEGQELFLSRHAHELGAKVLIGVGGTLDVLAGEVKRMPAWTTRLGVEWLFRVTLDRRRWKRVPRLAKFLWLVLREGALAQGVQGRARRAGLGRRRDARDARRLYRTAGRVKVRLSICHKALA